MKAAKEAEQEGMTANGGRRSEEGNETAPVDVERAVNNVGLFWTAAPFCRASPPTSRITPDDATEQVLSP